MKRWFVSLAIIALGVGTSFAAENDPMADPMGGGMPDPMSDPMGGGMPDPMASSDPMADPMATNDSMADPMSSGMPDPMSDPMAGGSSDPMADPMAESTPDPMADPMAAPAPAMDPMGGGMSDPMNDPMSTPAMGATQDPMAGGMAAAPAVMDASTGAPSMQLGEKADPLVKGAGFTERKVLMTQADEVKRTVRPLMQRLEDHKSSWYGKYLGLDAKLDGFYQQLGLSRGSLAEDIGDVIEVLVAEVMAGGARSPGADFQKKIDDHKKKLSELEPAIVDVSRQEQMVIDLLRQLSEQVDKVHDIVAEINNKAGELRGLDSDEIATQYGSRLAALKIEAETAEQAIQGGIVKQLDKAFVDTEARLGPVQQKVSALQQEGLDFIAKAQALAPKRPKRMREHLEQPGAVQDAPNEAHGKKKSKSNGRVDGMVAGTVLEKPYEVTKKVAGKTWDYLKPVRSSVGTIFDGIVGSGMNLVRRLFGMGPITDELTGNGLDMVQKNDPVLETIRIERNQAYSAARNIVSQRQALAEKEKLLDRLEAERVMQMDKREEVMAELDKSYQRSNRELSWWGLGKRIMWKVGASVRRLFMPLRNALFGPAQPKVRQRQRQQFTPQAPTTMAPGPGAAAYMPPRPQPQYAGHPGSSGMPPQQQMPMQQFQPQMAPHNAGHPGSSGMPQPTSAQMAQMEITAPPVAEIDAQATANADNAEAMADKFIADMDKEPENDELAAAEAEMAKLEKEMEELGDEPEDPEGEDSEEGEE